MSFFLSGKARLWYCLSMENNTMPQKTGMSLEKSEYDALVIETKKAMLAYKIAEEKFEALASGECDEDEDLELLEREMKWEPVWECDEQGPMQEDEEKLGFAKA